MSDWNKETVYEDLIQKMKEKGIAFIEHPDREMLRRVQRRYGISFPNSLIHFYELGMPISGRFVNWLDDSEENRQHIRRKMEFPMHSVLRGVEIEEVWPAAWGVRPEEDRLAAWKAQFYLDDAAALIPLYGHRYLVCLDGVEDPPVLSVFGGDIIFYGASLSDWLEIEFLGKPQSSVYEAELPEIPGWNVLIG